jgi:hypothetical protein
LSPPPPPTHPPDRATALRAAAAADDDDDARAVLSIPTFPVIILQGVVGSMPWVAIVFCTLFL